MQIRVPVLKINVPPFLNKCPSLPNKLSFAFLDSLLKISSLLLGCSDQIHWTLYLTDNQDNTSLLATFSVWDENLQMRSKLKGLILNRKGGHYLQKMKLC